MAEPQTPPSYEQLSAEVAEVKKVVLAIRRSQRRAAIAGVVKAIVYVALLGGAYLAMQPLLQRGMSVLSGQYYREALQEAGVEGEPAGLNGLLQELRRTQSDQVNR
jgi:hypothetical protein